MPFYANFLAQNYLGKTLRLVGERFFIKGKAQLRSNASCLASSGNAAFLKNRQPQATHHYKILPKSGFFAL
jgi:hypothetical protein